MTFEYQPTLRNDVIELRPLRADDFDALYAVASDPLLWAQHPESNRWEKPVFRAFFDDGLASGGALVALDATTQRVIGSSRYHGYDAEKDEVEVGWTFLDRSCWGGAHNGAMKSLMLRHAFQFVNNVVLLIAPNNIRSQRAAMKVGGVRDGSRHDDTGLESFVYRISRPADADSNC